MKTTHLVLVIVAVLAGAGWMIFATGGNAAAEDGAADEGGARDAPVRSEAETLRAFLIIGFVFMGLFVIRFVQDYE